MPSKNLNKKILVLGSRGMVGSSVVRTLSNTEKFEVISSNRKITNLFSLEETQKLFNDLKPDYIVNAAAKVGGILANNTKRTEFILSNLKINMNIIESLIDHKNTKLINLGSSCIYPLGADVPISESSLMSGTLEPTNSPYAMAKLTAIEMGDAISKEFGHKIYNLMPTNLYGPKDNYHPQNSHVIPALIRRFHEAKIHNKDFVEIWGTGKARREFLFVDDLAKACLFVMNISTEKINKYIDPMCSHLNIGSGEDMTILSLANKIKDVVGYDGEIRFDNRNIDGTPRKLLDISKITQLGWKPEVSLLAGLEITYKAFLKEFNL